MSVRRSEMAPPPGEVLVRLRAGQPSLSPAERKIADFLLTRPAEAIYLSITAVAERVGVGEATVSRFSRHLGFRGFQDVKLAIAQELVPGALAVADLGAGGAGPELLRHVAWRSVKVIEDTARLLDAEALERAVTILTAAHKIDFYGVGASGLTALDAQHRFLRIGKMCNAYVDAHVQAMSASLLDPKDAALAFSHSGGTRDVVLALEQARSAGARTIAVTGQARSPVARQADVVLLAASGESTLVSTLHSKIAHLFVLELLVDACVQRMEGSAEDAIQRSTDAVMDRMF